VELAAMTDQELLAYEREHHGDPFRPPVQHIRHCLPRHGSPIACITWIRDMDVRPAVDYGISGLMFSLEISA
jgi:hypothetical protein